MSKYNLLQYGTVLANTSSGTGNVSVDHATIATLYNDITTSGSFNVTSTGTLYLDIDLGNRIKLDSFSLYLTSSGTPANIIADNLRVYYKDELSDTYVSGTLNYTDTYHVVGYTLPFAPRYFRLTLSGIDCTVNEIILYNDDTIVDYGSDGTAGSIFANTQEEYITLLIFNSSSIGTLPANAYVSVDWSNGEAYNNYVKISNFSITGYKGISEGVTIDGENNFNWNGLSHVTKTEVDSTNGYIRPFNVNYPRFDPALTGYFDDSTILINDNQTFKITQGATWKSSLTRIKLPQYSGKWYWEATLDIADNPSEYHLMVGFVLSKPSSYNLTSSIGIYDSTWALYTYSGYNDSRFHWDNGLRLDGGDEIMPGSTVGVAVDLDTGYFWFAVDGVWQWSGDPANGTSPHRTDMFTYMTLNDDYNVIPAVSLVNTGDELSINLGQNTFVYTPPLGFKAATESINDQYYVSPIIPFYDKGLANQIYLDTTSVSGSDVTKDTFDSGGNLEVRSSNTSPEVAQLLFIASQPSNYTIRLYRYNVNLGTGTEVSTVITSDTNYWPSMTLCNNKYGYVYVFTPHNDLNSYTRIYDVTHDIQATYVHYNPADADLRFDYDVQCTGDGTIWGYSSWQGKLCHYSADLVEQIYNYDYGSDFISGLAADLTGDGIWYVNKNSKSLVHLDGLGVEIVDITLVEPKDVAATSDGGCWANDAAVVTRYDINGNVLTSVTMPNKVHIMCQNWEDGFWCICKNGILYNVNGSGVIQKSTYTGFRDDDYKAGTTIHSYAKYNIRYMILRPTSGGVYVYKQYAGTVDIYSKTDCSLLDTYNITVGGTIGVSSVPDVFFIDHNNYDSIKYTLLWRAGAPDPVDPLYPVPSDPVWGKYSNLEWRTINRDGNFLSKENYQQFKISFTLASGVTEFPYLKSAYIPPAIELVDVAPQNSKNIYIKTNFPEDTTMFDYDIKLKTWWGI